MPKKICVFKGTNREFKKYLRNARRFYIDRYSVLSEIVPPSVMTLYVQLSILS
jgi:hypothetical protein